MNWKTTQKEVMTTLLATKKKKVPFRFLNLWDERDDFLAIVSSSRQTQITGTPMYQFTTKLRLLKIELNKFHKQHTNHITSRVSQSRYAWNAAQTILDDNPASSEARVNERATANHYMQLCKDEELFFR